TTVLGFEQVGEFAAPGGERRKVFLRHRNLELRVGLTEHRAGSSDGFDETHVGLDHLAFRASSVAELDEWQARLEELDVPHTPVPLCAWSPLSVRTPHRLRSPRCRSVPTRSPKQPARRPRRPITTRTSSRTPSRSAARSSPRTRSDGSTTVVPARSASPRRRTT